ncbi:MAG: 4-alpha-glucanotransferase, partial [Muribaculaceae bacterium]|nr:4-alpha-glucanotransferase [Muribaculaceae bacterium]
MKLILNVDYRTNWGESIYITGNIPALGNSQPAKALPMTLDGEQHWFIELQLPDKCRRFSYRYMVHNDADGTTTRNEWGPDHTFFATPEAAEVIVYDRWQDMPFDKPFYSSAFVDCICARHGKDSPLMFTEGRLTLRVSAPLVAPDETLGIIGDGELFGNWDESRVVKMNNAEFPLWNVSLQLDKLSFPFEYKFVIIDAATGAIKAWEGGENRRLVVNPSPEGKAVVMGGMRYINPRNPWHGAGLAIPVFSLRSDEDFGVGDFYDLKKMVDWAVKTGQKFIQILPINDTTMTHTWTDSYPYNANSTFALHPMYLRLEAVGELNDENRRHYYSDLKHELSLSETVEYERVNNAKMAYLREIYEQNAGATIENADYQKFVERNLSWLKPYAAFCVLRDKFETPEFDRWGDMAVYDEPKVDAFVEANQKEIHFVYFLQYHLDKQMREVSRYAHEHGVALKGDIPIGISRTSADAWLSPRLFNLDCQAGAPPDDFSVLGQNWG